MKSKTKSQFNSLHSIDQARTQGGSKRAPPLLKKEEIKTIYVKFIKKTCSII